MVGVSRFDLAHMGLVQEIVSVVALAAVVIVVVGRLLLGCLPFLLFIFLVQATVSVLVGMIPKSLIRY